MKWRLIVTPEMSPAFNMTLDEELLASVQPGSPVLRFYSWSPPAVSLGHFQRIAPQTAQEWEQRGFTLVRRITGGGAIVHQNDFTYSIVLAHLAELGLSHHAELYELAHRIIAQALKNLGIEAYLRGVSEIVPPSALFWCSARKSKYDLMAAGKKLLGSAQRRRGPAILQHGSMLLVQNHYDEGLISLTEAAGRPVRFDEMAHLIRTAFANSLNATFSLETPHVPPEGFCCNR